MAVELILRHRQLIVESKTDNGRASADRTTECPIRFKLTAGRRPDLPTAS